MKSGMVACAQREPVEASLAQGSCFLPGWLSGAIRVSARLVRDMTCCGFHCCQREWALDSSRCFKIRQKDTIMQPNGGKAAAYKAGLSPQSRTATPARQYRGLTFLPRLQLGGICNWMLHCSSSWIIQTAGFPEASGFN